MAPQKSPRCNGDDDMLREKTEQEKEEHERRMEALRQKNIAEKQRIAEQKKKAAENGGEQRGLKPLVVQSEPVWTCLENGTEEFFDLE